MARAREERPESGRRILVHSAPDQAAPATPNPYDEEEDETVTWEEIFKDRLADAGYLVSAIDEAGDHVTLMEAPVGEVERIAREALLSDEAVERAARALYAEDVSESMDTPWPDYDSPQNLGRSLYEERARNALTAAIGDDDE